MDTEARIDQRLAQEDLAGAVTLAIEAYGGELLGFIHSRLGDAQAAQEVFSWLLEDLWRGLSSYSQRASFRAWAYALARNACHRYLDRELRPRRRLDPLSQSPALRRAFDQVRTQTALHLRTTGKERAQLLRDRLSEQEQVLLTLRVDRKLDWREVAEAMGAAEPDLDREAARLRKRYQLTKDKLKKWASDAGWLSGESSE